MNFLSDLQNSLENNGLSTCYAENLQEILNATERLTISRLSLHMAYEILACLLGLSDVQKCSGGLSICPGQADSQL